MTAAKTLYELYRQAKKQDNCLDYINELCDQIELFGTETNSLTRDHVLNRLETIINKIKNTF